MRINLTYVLIAAIIGLSILGYGTLSFISKQQERADQQAKVRANKLALADCLEKAEKEFDDTFTINSYKDPRPDYPNARTWNGSWIKEQTTKKLEDDKVLCAKLYGNQ